MHPLQLQIAMRAAALLKVGGLVAYSTCSLNPLENESVVAELLKRGRGALELVDCSSMLPELHRAQGLHTWTILDDDLREHASYEALKASTSLPAALKWRWMPSMWPPPREEAKALHLERCLRLLPHLANMGGFFVALIRKRAPLPGPPPRGGADAALARRAGAPATSAAKEEEDAPPPPPSQPCADVASVSPTTKPPRASLSTLPGDAIEALASQLGLKRSSVVSELGGELLCASARAGVVSRVVPELAPLLLDHGKGPNASSGSGGSGGSGGTSRSSRARRAKRLRVITAGCTLARRSRKGIFQLTVEGARLLAPLASKKRRLKLAGEDALALLRRADETSKARRALPLSALSPKAAQRAREMPAGPCLLLLQPADESRPPVPLPARRLRNPEAVRLLVPYTAGLEFRPAAVLHSLRSQLA